ncbi:MAG: hypothetical protein L7F77_10645 [Candidatus Magnetominusculus sp. LBB02]|nr:hypothetical protein [Candidatus Magnetominusculus sp. LBB02]
MSPDKLQRLREKILEGGNPKPFIPLSEEYKNSGMTAEAIYILEQCIEKFPKFMSARVALGNLYMEKGAFIHAIDEFVAVVETIPDNVLTHRKLAELYSILGDTENALSSYQTILSLKPADRDAEQGIRKLLYKDAQEERPEPEAAPESPAISTEEASDAGFEIECLPSDDLMYEDELSIDFDLELSEEAAAPDSEQDDEFGTTTVIDEADSAAVIDDIGITTVIDETAPDVEAAPPAYEEEYDLIGVIDIPDIIDEEPAPSALEEEALSSGHAAEKTDAPDSDEAEEFGTTTVIDEADSAAVIDEAAPDVEAAPPADDIAIVVEDEGAVQICEEQVTDDIIPETDVMLDKESELTGDATSLFDPMDDYQLPPDIDIDNAGEGGEAAGPMTVTDDSTYIETDPDVIVNDVAADSEPEQAEPLSLIKSMSDRQPPPEGGIETIKASRQTEPLEEKAAQAEAAPTEMIHAIAVDYAPDIAIEASPPQLLVNPVDDYDLPSDADFDDDIGEGDEPEPLIVDETANVEAAPAAVAAAVEDVETAVDVKDTPPLLPPEDEYDLPSDSDFDDDIEEPFTVENANDEAVSTDMINAAPATESAVDSAPVSLISPVGEYQLLTDIDLGDIKEAAEEIESAPLIDDIALDGQAPVGITNELDTESAPVIVTSIDAVIDDVAADNEQPVTAEGGEDAAVARLSPAAMINDQVTEAMPLIGKEEALPSALVDAVDSLTRDIGGETSELRAQPLINAIIPVGTINDTINDIIEPVAADIEPVIVTDEAVEPFSSVDDYELPPDMDIDEADGGEAVDLPATELLTGGIIVEEAAAPAITQDEYGHAPDIVDVGGGVAATQAQPVIYEDDQAGHREAERQDVPEPPASGLIGRLQRVRRKITKTPVEKEKPEASEAYEPQAASEVPVQQPLEEVIADVQMEQPPLEIIAEAEAVSVEESKPVEALPIVDEESNPVEALPIAEEVSKPAGEAAPIAEEQDEYQPVQEPLFAKDTKIISNELSKRVKGKVKPETIDNSRVWLMQELDMVDSYIITEHYLAAIKAFNLLLARYPGDEEILKRLDDIRNVAKLMDKDDNTMIRKLRHIKDKLNERKE